MVWGFVTGKDENLAPWIVDPTTPKLARDLCGFFARQVSRDQMGLIIAGVKRAIADKSNMM